VLDLLEVVASSQQRLAELQLEFDTKLPTTLHARSATNDATSATITIGDSTTATLPGGKSTKRRLLRRKRDEVERAYRVVSGVSFFSVSATADEQRDGVKLVGISFDATHRGRYVQSYLLVLQYRQETQLFSIRNHTIPYVIPVSLLAEQHLNSNLKMFITAVGDYIDALVSYRAETLEEEQ